MIVHVVVAITNIVWRCRTYFCILLQQYILIYKIFVQTIYCCWPTNAILFSLNWAGENGVIFSKYVDLIQRAWDHDPLNRPSAVVRLLFFCLFLSFYTHSFFLLFALFHENPYQYYEHYHRLHRHYSPLFCFSTQTVLAELEDLWHNSTAHLLCTTDAAQVADEGYSRYLVHNANRMGSITGTLHINECI